jgi:hypothetical protein
MTQPGRDNLVHPGWRSETTSSPRLRHSYKGGAHFEPAVAQLVSSRADAGAGLTCQREIGQTGTATTRFVARRGLDRGLALHIAAGQASLGGEKSSTFRTAVFFWWVHIYDVVSVVPVPPNLPQQRPTTCATQIKAPPRPNLAFPLIPLITPTTQPLHHYTITIFIPNHTHLFAALLVLN